jgi:type VI secretion system protein ImpG
MDKRLLGYYNRELQHLRSSSGEFAREFPKIASRLSLDEFDCADPYVERLLEGFAFLSARVQLKLDAEFPRFTQSILEAVYPHYLAPTPSMAVVQFQPDMSDGGLAGGYRIERNATMRANVGRDERTACEYRTGHAVTLWPVALAGAEYYTRGLATLDLPAAAGGGRAAIGFTLEAGAGLSFADIALDELTFYIRGADELPMRIYEQVFAHGRNVVVRPAEKPTPWQHTLPGRAIRQVGFEEDEALLPVSGRSFDGYRLLSEYFAFPARFLFFKLTGLREHLAQCKGNRIEVFVLLDEEDVELEGRIDASHFSLYSVPVINLFPKRADRIHLSDKVSEFHVVPDRTRPRDFEVYQVKGVTGFGMTADDVQPFAPFYAASDFDESRGGTGAYFTVNREPRMVSSKERERGRRSSYGGSEVFLILVDAQAAPYRSELRQLGVETLCTNRDLPLQMGVGRMDTDFSLEASAPVTAIRCLAGPSAPQASCAEGEVSWRLISHLSLNYLSLVDNSEGEGAAALRDMLKLYGNADAAQIRKQVEGVLSVKTQAVTRRIVTRGPLSLARGLGIKVTLDEEGFQGTGVFILGAVLERFFAKYVSINSFTETTIATSQRGEIMRWPTRLGIQRTL